MFGKGVVACRRTAAAATTDELAADEPSETTDHTDAGHPTTDADQFAQHGVPGVSAAAQRETAVGGGQSEDAEGHGKTDIAGPAGTAAGHHGDVHERLGHGVGDDEKRRYGLVEERRDGGHVLPESVLDVFAGRPDSVRVESQLVRLQFGPVPVQFQHAAVPVGLRRRDARQTDHIAADPRAGHQRDGLGDDVLRERRRRFRHGDGDPGRARTYGRAYGPGRNETRRQRDGAQLRGTRGGTRRRIRIRGRVRPRRPSDVTVDHDPAVSVQPAPVHGRGASRQEPGEFEEREPVERQNGVPVLAHVLRARHRLGQHIRLHQFGLRDQEAYGRRQEKRTEKETLATGRGHWISVVQHHRRRRRRTAVGDGRVRQRPSTAGRARQER